MFRRTKFSKWVKKQKVFNPKNKNQIKIAKSAWNAAINESIYISAYSDHFDLLENLKKIKTR